MKSIKYTFLVAALAIAGYSVYSSQTKVEMSELTIENIEAIASDEEENGAQEKTEEREDVEERIPLGDGSVIVNTWIEISVTCYGLGPIECISTSYKEDYSSSIE